MPELPPRIARVGLAVELEDGNKMFLVSDQVSGFLELETFTTYGTGYDGGQHVVEHSLDLHITDLHNYRLIYNLPDTTKQLDAMSTAVEEPRRA